MTSNKADGCTSYSKYFERSFHSNDSRKLLLSLLPGSVRVMALAVISEICLEAQGEVKRAHFILNNFISFYYKL